MSTQQARTVFITGHTTPDTDPVCSAIAYADFKNQIDKGHLFMPKDFIPAIGQVLSLGRSR